MGWVVTKVHYVLEYRQTRFLKSYVERNQKLRQKAMNPVDSNLSKFMNNTLFGKLCSKVSGRKEHTIIFDEQRACETYDIQCDKEGRANKWKDTPEYREIQAFEQFQKETAQINKVEVIGDNADNLIIAREACQERLDEKLYEADCAKKKRVKWHGRYKNQVSPRTALEQLVDAMRDPHTSQCTKLNTENNAAIEYIVTRNQRKTTVKSERLVAACILAEAKISITNFNRDYYKTMEHYVDHLDYAPWVADMKALKVNVVNTDTDSLCFWTQAHFEDKSANGNADNNDAYKSNTNAHIPEDQEVNDFKEFLIQKYMGSKMDTANYSPDNKYYTAKYKKDLHRFQRDVVDPHYIRRLIAVNPKEYFVEKSNDHTVKKHKGVKRNTKLTLTTYLDNIKTVDDIYECLERDNENENSTKHVERFRQERLQMKAGIVTKVVSHKVALSRLHDKRYFFRRDSNSSLWSLLA